MPGAVVDFDVTEGGRAVGLAFLTAGRYFLVNNGPYYQNYDVPIDPQKDNWNLFFHKGPARTWITRSTYGYDKWIPSELFLTHYFPDDPEDVAARRRRLAHPRPRRDLGRPARRSRPRASRASASSWASWRQVRDSMAAASPVRTGAVGGSGEVHEKIEHETGRGAIVVFSTASRPAALRLGAPRRRASTGRRRARRVTFDAAGPRGRGRRLREARAPRSSSSGEPATRARGVRARGGDLEVSEARTRVVAVIALSVLPAAASSGQEGRAQPAASPAWPTARPADLGLRPEVLDGALADLLGANKTGAAVLAVKGKLVWERYWNGFGPSSRFDVYSAGKAYAATAIGLLADDGKLKIDDPACLYLTEWAVDDRRKITIRHLLTMTSGLKLDYEGFKAAENPTAATLGWPLERPPGTAWSYEQATAQAVGLIVQRVTGQQPIVFLRERVLDPIGAVETDWLRSRQGDCLGWRSVLTSARELALFGQLYLNQGRWNGRQLVSRGVHPPGHGQRPAARRDPHRPGAGRLPSPRLRLADVREHQRDLGGSGPPGLRLPRRVPQHLPGGSVAGPRLRPDGHAGGAEEPRGLRQRARCDRRGDGEGLADRSVGLRVMAWRRVRTWTGNHGRPGGPSSPCWVPHRRRLSRRARTTTRRRCPRTRCPTRCASRTAVPCATAAEWPERRAEVLRLFEEHVYGRSPAAPSGMRFVVVESDARALGGLATRRQVRVLLDGTESGPAFEILLYVPNAAPPARPRLPRPELRRQPRGPPRPGHPALDRVDGRGPRRRGEPRDRGRAGDERGRLAGRADPRPRLRARHRLLRRPRARPPGRLERTACGPGSARAPPAASRPTTGGRSAPGPGASAARSTTWRRTPTWTAGASP